MFASLSRFARLPSQERRLRLGALALLAPVRLLLWLFPLRAVRSILSGVERLPGTPVDAPPERVAGAVEAAARYVPRATCLTRALTAQVMLRRRGREALLRVGLRRGEDGVEGHAWLESDGLVVLGGAIDLARYERLERLEQEHNAVPRSES
jgi:hypothetical protein